MIKIEKRIHRGWEELEDTKVNYPTLYLPIQHFGKYQYIFSCDDIKISLIELPNYFITGEILWEIHQIEGNKELFDDCQRYPTRDDASDAVRNLFIDYLCKRKKK